MKAEDKILELLTEYIQKTDRTLEEMSKHEKQINSATQQINSAYQQINSAYQFIQQHAEEIKALRQESVALRQESLKREIQQEAILKEIFSISKRVSDLEK
jgi:methyl-accepting chemotaxis protein